MSEKNHKKSATRTIRLDEEQDQALIKEAERRGFSVNALISNIFNRYLAAIRFQDSAGMVTFSGETFSEFIARLDNEEIHEIGATTGGKHVQGSLMQRGMRVNYENVVWYMTQILGEYDGWFRCDRNTVESRDTFHLTHKMGYKWSAFLESYLSAAFDEALGVKLNTVVMINAVNLEVRK
ncbi:hypothetical protein JXL21_11460 [Candidatus Bathyarchaeota archaeon]|nr:hypothetical protein [Candidatus Bathyarchaeota archaeon]